MRTPYGHSIPPLPVVCWCRYESTLEPLCALVVRHMVPPVPMGAPDEGAGSPSSHVAGVGSGDSGMAAQGTPQPPGWTFVRLLTVNASRLAVHRFRRRLERLGVGGAFEFQDISLPWAPSDVAWMVSRRPVAGADVAGGSVMDID